MNTPQPETESSPANNALRDDPVTPRVRFSMVITLLGLLVFAIGAKPVWFNLDRRPVVGFVQISVFLVGLAIICLGGYIGLLTLWWGRERTIISDIGARLIGTGYVVSIFAGLADVFGMGTQAFPQSPHFGPWQASGVLIGQGIIALGFLLLIPFHNSRK